MIVLVDVLSRLTTKALLILSIAFVSLSVVVPKTYARVEDHQFAIQTRNLSQKVDGGIKGQCKLIIFSHVYRLGNDAADYLAEEEAAMGLAEYDTRQSDLERLFSKYGKVDRADIKSGFTFLYMDDEQDVEDAIRGLNKAEFGRQRRWLLVEWTKQECGIKRPGGSRSSSGSLKPTKTLFVINFDPINTRMGDLERHLDPYGKISNIRIRRNFAFIQFESQEDATKALDATNMSKMMDPVISVEYTVREDDDRRNGYSPDRRGRDRSPERRSRDHGRSRVFMEELLRGLVLIMAVLLVHITGLKKEVAPIMVVLPVPVHIRRLEKGAVLSMVVLPVPVHIPKLKKGAVPTMVMLLVRIPGLKKGAVPVMAVLLVSVHKTMLKWEQPCS